MMSCGVTKFLCCLPLSLGAYIIGAISILAPAILIILDSVYFAGGLFAIEDIFQDYENDCNDYYSDCGDFDLGMIEAVVSALESGLPSTSCSSLSTQCSSTGRPRRDLASSCPGLCSK